MTDHDDTQERMRALTPEEIERLLAPLDERLREILVLRYGFDRGEARTLQEVADRFNLTVDRIRQLEAAALVQIGERPSDTPAT